MQKGKNKWLDTDLDMTPARMPAQRLNGKWRG
jgi:hypothetical protein